MVLVIVVILIFIDISRGSNKLETTLLIIIKIETAANYTTRITILTRGIVLLVDISTKG